MGVRVKAVAAPVSEPWGGGYIGFGRHKSDFSRLLIFVCKFFTSALNFAMSSLISDRLTASFTIRYRINKTTKSMIRLAIRPPKPNAEPITTPPYHGILLSYLQLYHYTRSSSDRMVKQPIALHPDPVVAETRRLFLHFLWERGYTAIVPWVGAYRFRTLLTNLIIRKAAIPLTEETTAS